ncbi:MAG: putative heptosyltransferase [Candidatus Scalindua rubra]|uniref:Putative heptosyltransferase n=1 Tax=Candidatus Scalindua rubra TaxID=1872076 RepID=A0A1E3XI45_9BACT|nr:MAG: putative heptosyltransferase [Candidatus Scalindua rubra]
MNRVLIVHTWGIGDWLYFTPVLKGLVAKYPHAQIDVLLGTPMARAIMDYYPEVRVVGVGDVTKGFWSVVYHVLKSRRNKYDLLLFSAGVSSRKADLLSLLIRAEQKVALRTVSHIPLFLTAWKNYDYKKHILENNLQLRSLIGLEITEKVCTYLPHEKSVEIMPNSLLIHPGCNSTHSYKRWPVKRFVQVANNLLNGGRSVSVVLGPDELEMKDDFSSLQKFSSFRLLMNLSFANLLEEISKHELFFCSDSALGHIAAALDKLVVTILGPGDPVITRPYSKKTRVLRTERNLNCMPCMRPGGKHGCHERSCLTDITVEKSRRCDEK